MKKSKIRLICLIVSVFTLLTLVVGCGTQTTSPSGQSSSSAQSVASSQSNVSAESNSVANVNTTIVMQASKSWINDPDRQNAEGFKAQTGITVDIQTFPDDQYENVIKVKLNSKEAGDMIFVRTGADMRDYFPENNLADLSNYSYVSRINDYAKNSVTYNGKIYAVPLISPGGWGIVYNKKIFAQYNLKTPTNFDELCSVCDTLLANGITPFYEWGAGVWHYGKWFYGVAPAATKEVPDLFSKLNKNETKFTDIKTFATFLDQFKIMANKGYFGKTYQSDTWERAFEELGSGKYAMGLLDSIMVSEIIKLYPEQSPDDYSEFPEVLAGCQQFSANTGGVVIGVNKLTKVMDAVNKYIDYITADTQLVNYYKTHTQRTASVWKGIDGKRSAAYDSVVANSVGGIGFSLEGNMLYANEVEIHKYMQDFLLGGKSSKDVLASIDDYRQKLFGASK